MLLARFATAHSRDRVLELCAGSGVISMILATLHNPREIAAIEIQPKMVSMIRRSAELNGLQSIRAVEADLRSRSIAGIEPASFDVVIANPPWRAGGTGRESPEHGRRISRAESAASLDDIVKAAARYARDGARAALVMTAARSAELISVMRSRRLEPKRIRFVHPYVDAPASAILVEARKGGGIEARVDQPLVVWASERTYTDEARRLLEQS